ncbi:hypothetical protein [Pontibacter sp. BAB1700]|uniref:hypothetical protein n=1 Tax=Pontibacter sp. BAB1700 TaxID=1144253 RepID=UPI00026BE0A5|nr:hypothetical protein [Pontibacter sp. BAB1700]EJF10814.1 hypothetical protein O71_07084 [Pontibacter sp. BAB1700]
MAEVLEPDLALVPDAVLLSEEDDLLLLLLEVGLEPEEDDALVPELPWFDDPILEPLWLELPDDMPLDMLPDWLDD